MNKCPNCGKTLDEGETVCTNCGVNILEERNLELETVEKNEDYRPKRFVSKTHYGPNLFKHDEDFLLLNEYIGKNVSKMKNGFSWCSFFFGPLYMFYRKMWGLGVILIVIYSAIGYLVPNATIAIILELVCALILGLKFKDIYIQKALKEIDIIKANNPDKKDDELIADVAYKGGVSQLALFVVVAIIILLAILNSALLISGVKMVGGSIYDLAKDRLEESKKSFNQIKGNVRQNTETNAVGKLYIVFPKGYTPTTEVYETNATFENKTIRCQVITNQVDANEYNGDVRNYLDIKTKSPNLVNRNLEYKDIIIKDHSWTMVKSTDTTPQYVTYTSVYDGMLYDVTFEAQSDTPELCFASSEITSMSFMFK